MKMENVANGRQGFVRQHARPSHKHCKPCAKHAHAPRPRARTRFCDFHLVEFSHRPVPSQWNNKLKQQGDGAGEPSITTNYELHGRGWATRAPVAQTLQTVRVDEVKNEVRQVNFYGWKWWFVVLFKYYRTFFFAFQQRWFVKALLWCFVVYGLKIKQTIVCSPGIYFLARSLWLHSNTWFSQQFSNRSVFFFS